MKLSNAKTLLVTWLSQEKFYTSVIFNNFLSIEEKKRMADAILFYSVYTKKYVVDMNISDDALIFRINDEYLSYLGVQNQEEWLYMMYVDVFGKFNNYCRMQIIHNKKEIEKNMTTNAPIVPFVKLKDNELTSEEMQTLKNKLYSDNLYGNQIGRESSFAESNLNKLLDRYRIFNLSNLTKMFLFDLNGLRKKIVQKYETYKSLPFSQELTYEDICGRGDEEKMIYGYWVAKKASQEIFLEIIDELISKLETGHYPTIKE